MSGIPDHIAKALKESKYLFNDSDTKWADGKIKAGPAPSDLGDHDPIPDEAVEPLLIEADDEIGEEGEQDDEE